MDLQKEREAFEESFKIKWEIGHYILKMVKFIEDSQDYAPVNAVKQMSDEYYWVLALNTGWWAWQAAKTQQKTPQFNLDEFLTMEENLKHKGGVIKADLDRFIAYAEMVLEKAKALKEPK